MLKIKTPNFLFGSFYSSLKNAILKKNSTFTTYISKLILTVSLYLLKKRYFTNVELFQLDSNIKKRGFVLYITINYGEDLNIFNNISLLYSKKRYISYSYKQLKYLRKIKRFNLILLTSSGVLSMSEALMHKIGGIPLIELF